MDFRRDLPSGAQTAHTFYDVEEIIDCSRRLYQRASFIVVMSAAVAFVGCGIVGGIAGYFLGQGNEWVPAFAGVLLAAIGGMVGYQIGMNQSVVLRLEAQNALCNLQTAINTEPR